jgi:metal-dependent amidase/aminoacylase/carboxypeptidase family protein
MRNVFFFVMLSVSVFTNAQTPSPGSSKSKFLSAEANCKLETDKIFEKLVKIRRNLHAIPELAGKEKRTQETIKKYLIDLGLEVKTDIYGYGLVGILKGAKKGKSIAWRADMDALPNDFPDDVEFKSTIKGAQHGCGHDVHMAIALGIAEVLANNKKDLRGTVYFIFQPEEESFKGAKGMVENKLFSRITPSEIYGLHITPFAVGQIIVKANEMYAYQKGVRIQFQKNVPEESIKNLMLKMSSVLTRTINNSKPWELHHALDPEKGLASPNTIFRDYFLMDQNYVNSTKNDTLTILADVYETEKSKLNNVIPAITKVIESEGLKDELISISFFKENPTIQNDPKLTDAAIKILDDSFGKGTVTMDYGQIPFSNDDFSYLQEKVPGVYFFLGGSNFQKGMIAMIHAPNFMVDEESIRFGVSRFATLIMERSKNK